MAFLCSFADMCMHKVAKNLSRPVYTFPAEVEQGDALLSCFSSHSVNECLCHVLFSVTFLIFLCFLLLIYLFKMAPKQNSELLSTISKQKGWDMPHRKNTYAR